MSYRCTINFKKIEADKVIDFLKTIKKTYSERMKEVAAAEYSFCPFIRTMVTPPDKFGDIEKNKIKESQAWAQQSIFKFRYFYNNELKLLGVFGVSTPIDDIFDKTVYFQNSCDNDYDRASWEGIEVFESIYDKWMNKSDKEIAEFFNKKENENLADVLCDDNCGHVTDEDMKNKLDYERRSFAYDEIWSYFEKELYDDDDAIYCSLYGYYDTQAIYQFLKFCYDKYVNWFETSGIFPKKDKTEDHE